MSTLALDVEKTLRSLDPPRASALERVFRDLLAFAGEGGSSGNGEQPAAVDANGWPIGYWEQYAGCLAGEEWEPSPDPPPEPSLEP